jgi:hypothetical protein
MLVMEVSAVGLLAAAEREVKASGSEVPNATIVMAVQAGCRPTRQPKRVALSEIQRVMPPMSASAIPKAGQPFSHVADGIKA